MKLLKFQIWLAAFCYLCSAMGQGSVGLVNVNNNFIPPGGWSKAVVELTPGTPLGKAVGRIEVLDSTGAIISSVKDGTGNTFGANGLFFLGVLEIPGSVPGGSANMVIRVWDQTSGGTYANATVKASAWVTLSGLGGNDGPIPQLGQISDFAGLEGPLTPLPPADILIERTDGQWLILTKGPISRWNFLNRSSNLKYWSRGVTGHVKGDSVEWAVPDTGQAMFFRLSN